MNYSIFRVTVQVKTLILLKFFIADSPAKHQQSGKLGLYHIRRDEMTVRTKSNPFIAAFHSLTIGIGTGNTSTLATFHADSCKRFQGLLLSVVELSDLFADLWA